MMAGGRRPDEISHPTLARAVRICSSRLKTHARSASVFATLCRDPSPADHNDRPDRYVGSEQGESTRFGDERSGIEPGG
jgi:hypothetical protein